jgi:hypothetical protein
MNFEGWILVMNGGQMLVGKTVAHDDDETDEARLSPVYQLETSAVRAPNGSGMGVVRHMLPVMFCDIPYLNLPASYAWVPLAALSAQMQREIARGIEQAEQLRTQIRASESGLVIPGAVSK